VTTDNGNNVVSFPMPANPPDPKAAPLSDPDWFDKFMNKDLPMLHGLVETLSLANDEEEARLGMSAIRAMVSTWPI
jgi:hypothetical protein